MTGYWESRLMTQLVYLEELNAVNGGDLTDLLEEATAQLAARFDSEGTVTKQAALEIEAVMLPASTIAKAITVSCVAHAHIDMNWQWRFDETVMVVIDTLCTMLNLMREYPAFTFAQSQASVYKIVEEYAPEMLPEIRQRIREGRWEVTASTWVETDKNMPNGESLSRHLLYTRKYLKDLLKLTDDQFEIDFEPDTFGHGANVPEILASGGVRYYYHCRGYDGDNLYRWRSPSGAEVTVFRDPTWYTETISQTSFLYVPAFCKKYELDRLVHVYGVGDHGGGATRRDIERIMDYASWPCMPTLVFGRYIDFFHYLGTLDLPVVTKELNFIFDGCYTSQSRIKKANRVSEKALFEAEYFNVVANLCSAYRYDAKAFEKLWQNVLFSQFHDILPGSGVIDTREYSLGLFQQTMAGAGARQSAAVRAISAKINTAALSPAVPPLRGSTAEGAGAGFFVSMGIGPGNSDYTASSDVGGAQRLFVLYNPTQVQLPTTSTLTVWDWEGDLEQIEITDEEKRPAKHELLDKKREEFCGHKFFRVLLSCAVPPFGYRTVLLRESPKFKTFVPDQDITVQRSKSYTLENEFVRAVFDPRTAALVSFYDKMTGEDYIGKPGGGIFRLIEEDDENRGMTAWYVGRHINSTPVENVVKMTEISGTLRQGIAFEATVRSSKLSVTVTLGEHCGHLEYSVICDWREFGEHGKPVPQLSFGVPLSYPCEKFQYDNAFGIVSREGVDNDVPALTFACAPRGEGGLMLSSDSKYGYRCDKGRMSLTLIRSSYDPDPIPECYVHAFRITLGVVRDVAPMKLVETSLAHNRSVITVACVAGEGELPLTGSFIKISDGEAVISSVKAAEDGSGAIILRFYDVSGQDGSVAFEFFKPVKSAAYVDVHENELSADGASVLRNAVKASYRAFGVRALKISF